MKLFLTNIGQFLLSQENNFLVAIHNRVGELPFLVFSLVTAIVLGLRIIPYSTDLMTNSAAGLTEKFLGEKQRTLVINSTTNLPELFLMFIIAPVIVIGKWLVLAKTSKIKKFIKLLKKEKKLVFWHLILSFTMLTFSSLSCWLITGITPLITLPETNLIGTNCFLIIGGFICLMGVVIYFFFETKLKRKRPEIFEDLENEDFDASWIKFFLGTTGVILACYVLNLFFMAFTQLYEPLLKSFFGAAIFTYLHYFVGSFISSLPETTVAVENYERLAAPELNTALASASVSNMSNLAIAFIGSMIGSLLVLWGLVLEL